MRYISTKRLWVFIRMSASIIQEVANRSKQINVKFYQLAEDDKVQLNKHVTRSTEDEYEILSISTKEKILAQLTGGLEILGTKYK